MIINFNEKEAITIPGMNNGTGTMTAKMFMSDKGKIITCSIHKGGSIGTHKHETSDDINYVISGKGKAVTNGVEEILEPSVCHICPKGFNEFSAFGALGINGKPHTSAVITCSALFTAYLTIFARVFLFGILQTFPNIETLLSPFIKGIKARAGM